MNVMKAAHFRFSLASLLVFVILCAFAWLAYVTFVLRSQREEMARLRAWQRARVPVLVEKLSDSSTQAAAARQLGELELEAKDAIAPLLKTLGTLAPWSWLRESREDNTQIQARGEMYLALKRILLAVRREEGDFESAVPAVMSVMDSQPDNRFLFEVLTLMGSDVVPELIVRVKEERTNCLECIRSLALMIEALALMGAEARAALPVLVEKANKSGNDEVRFAAQAALARIGAGDVGEYP